MKLDNHSDERNKFNWTKEDLEDILKHSDDKHKFNVHSSRITTESVFECVVDLYNIYGEKLAPPKLCAELVN